MTRAEWMLAGLVLVSQLAVLAMARHHHKCEVELLRTIRTSLAAGQDRDHRILARLDGERR